MAAPALSDVRREVERIRREVPILTQGTKSYRALQDQANRARHKWAEATRDLIRACDQLIYYLEGDFREYAAEHPEILISAKKDRQEAFEDLGELDPEHQWFWTEEWQAGEREADREIAAGDVSAPMSGEEFLAELDSLIAAKG
jgi:hypothetical protein